MRHWFDAGANPNARVESGKTALMWAIQSSDVEFAKQLLVADANPNIATKDGETALMIAAFKRHTEVAKVLLSAGANLNAVFY